MDFLNQISQWIHENPGKTIGVAAGFIVGILLFTLGWWKTFIVLFLAFVGFLIGKSRDENIPIIDLITGLFKRNRD